MVKLKPVSLVVGEVVVAASLDDGAAVAIVGECINS